MNMPDEQSELLMRQGRDMLERNRLAEAKGFFTQACQVDPGNVNAWLTLSTIHGRLGEMSAAGECCRRVLSLEPEHCEAHVNLGNVLASQGRREEAAGHYEKALQLNAGHYGAGFGLGNVLTALGRYEEAAQGYQRAIQSNPNVYFAYVGLGHVRLQQGAYEKAANNYLQAVRLNPGDAGSRNGLGLALLKLGRAEEALASFEEAVRLKGDYAEALINAGSVLSDLGRYEEALERYERALGVSEAIPELHNNLGTVYLERGQLEAAIGCYQKALELNPGYVMALNNLGKACRFAGRLELYMEQYRRTTAGLAEAQEARRAFIENIGALVPEGYEGWLEEELKKCFALREVNFAPIAALSALLLKIKYDLPAAAQAGTGMEALIGRIGGDELFLLLLEKTINTDPDLENLLTDIRRVLLFKYGAAPGLTPGEAQVAYALACQCLNNEYVFAQDEGEGARVAVLKEAIERRVPVLSAADAELERDLVVYGMYDRLCSLSCREALHAISRDGWSEGFQGLLEQALLNPLEEDKIKAAIPTLGRLEDTTTRLVRSQYEENPYPRWISVPQLKKRNIKRVLKQLFPRFSPPDFLDSPIQFLVAGCGTGQHPIITSLTFDNVDITAVDISKSSLAYAIRMARGYGVKNIHFMQGDILELGELGRQFHIIESTGVLHHMEDPLAGWKVLTDLLIDDGLMSIGLYSEKARQHIVAARELIAREHLPSDTTSIRNLRTRIFRRELGDLLYSLTSSKDFYSTSGCRDLIFHSREHRFTLPQLDKAIQSLGLDFIGFEFEDTRVNSRYQEMFPTDEYMTNLTLWDHFEDNYPHTFARMYNFWCQKKR